MNSLIRTIRKIPLINQIAVGLVIGILLAVFLPGAVPVVSIFGDLFVKALKGVAPLLVFILVMNAMVQRKEGGDTQMKPIITLYVIGTFAASIVGVTLSFLFPQTLMLQLGNAKVNPPSGIAEVVHNLVLNIVDNPLNAILTANYIGILAWAVIIGLALHKSRQPGNQACTGRPVCRHHQSGHLGNPLRSLGDHGPGDPVHQRQRPFRPDFLFQPAGSAAGFLLPGGFGDESGHRVPECP